MRKQTGAGAAALVAAGLGTFLIGLMTALAAVSERLNSALNWYAPAGPLSGKTGVGVMTWLLAWFVLHTLWKKRNVNLDRAVKWTMLLLALGFLLTFPPVFEALAGE
jgi:uncharacterized protein YybS (DUF2232 family)